MNRRALLALSARAAVGSMASYTLSAGYRDEAVGYLLQAIDHGSGIPTIKQPTTT